MARLSDSIEAFIKALIDSSEPDSAEIQRNELANRFHCVPSQINYVIDTRFSPDQGYFVESRRGGGGCIRICRIRFEGSSGNYLMHVLAGIGERISQHHAQIFIRNFYEYDAITEREAKMLEAATSDKILSVLPPEERDQARAVMLKHILSSLLI